MSNVVLFSSKEMLRLCASDKVKGYSLDEISEQDVGGRVLIEACVPRAALAKFVAMLDSGDY